MFRNGWQQVCAYVLLLIVTDRASSVFTRILRRLRMWVQYSYVHLQESKSIPVICKKHAKNGAILNYSTKMYLYSDHLQIILSPNERNIVLCKNKPQHSTCCRKFESNSLWQLTTRPDIVHFFATGRLRTLSISLVNRLFGNNFFHNICFIRTINKWWWWWW